MNSNPYDDIHPYAACDASQTENIAKRGHIASQTLSHPGFTLVELLVVIVIIIALAGITFSITQNARRAAIKVADMQSLRSLATAAIASGSDNSGILPSIHGNTNSAPYWLKSREILEGSGIFKESCYIPSKNVQGGAPQYTFWYNFGNATPIHYCYFAKDGPIGSSWFENGTVVAPSKSEYRGAIPHEDIIKDASKAFARNITDDVWYPILWSGICRDYPGNKQLAAVMKDGVALGVNVLYLDGHAEWVDKSKMKARFSRGDGLKIYW